MEESGAATPTPTSQPSPSRLEAFRDARIQCFRTKKTLFQIILKPLVALSPSPSRVLVDGLSGVGIGLSLLEASRSGNTIRRGSKRVGSLSQSFNRWWARLDKEEMGKGVSEMVSDMRDTTPATSLILEQTSHISLLIRRIHPKLWDSTRTLAKEQAALLLEGKKKEIEMRKKKKEEEEKEKEEFEKKKKKIV